MRRQKSDKRNKKVYNSSNYIHAWKEICRINTLDVWDYGLRGKQVISDMLYRAGQDR